MMTAARRVQLAPLARLTEAEVVDRARRLPTREGVLRPGDAWGDLVVLQVDPAPAAELAAETEIEIVPTPRRADAASVDAAVMLDVGASMATPWDERRLRIDAAREALQTFLDAPGPSVASVAVYEFAKTCERVAGPAAGPLRLPKRREPRGASDTGAALDAVLADLSARAVDERSQVVLLLADGVGPVDELVAAGERAARLRVPVHALVFAPEVDEAFHELAAATGGSVQRAAYPLVIEFVHQPGVAS